MNVKYIILGVLFVVIGLVIMLRHKFYKYKTDDMLFATKFKVFFSGIIACFIGLYFLIHEIAKLLK